MFDFHILALGMLHTMSPVTLSLKSLSFSIIHNLVWWACHTICTLETSCIQNSLVMNHVQVQLQLVALCRCSAVIQAGVLLAGIIQASVLFAGGIQASVALYRCSAVIQAGVLLAGIIQAGVPFAGGIQASVLTVPALIDYMNWN